MEGLHFLQATRAHAAISAQVSTSLHSRAMIQMKLITVRLTLQTRVQLQGWGQQMCEEKQVVEVSHLLKTEVHLNYSPGSPSEPVLGRHWSPRLAA